MTRVLISKGLGITYGSQFTKTTDHFENWVPLSLDIMEELLLGNFDDFFGILRILEPSFLVAITDNLLKIIASCTWRTDHSDGGTTKCNGVTINCFIIGVRIWGGVKSPPSSLSRRPWLLSSRYDFSWYVLKRTSSSFWCQVSHQATVACLYVCFVLSCMIRRIMPHFSCPSCI